MNFELRTVNTQNSKFKTPEQLKTFLQLKTQNSLPTAIK
jgi:hypothetical protein